MASSVRRFLLVGSVLVISMVVGLVLVAGNTEPICQGTVLECDAVRSMDIQVIRDAAFADPKGFLAFMAGEQCDGGK